MVSTGNMVIVGFHNVLIVKLKFEPRPRNSRGGVWGAVSGSVAHRLPRCFYWQ